MRVKRKERREFVERYIVDNRRGPYDYKQLNRIYCQALDEQQGAAQESTTAASAALDEQQRAPQETTLAAAVTAAAAAAVEGLCTNWEYWRSEKGAHIIYDVVHTFFNLTMHRGEC
jgi:hypothetical protein